MAKHFVKMVFQDYPSMIMTCTGDKSSDCWRSVDEGVEEIRDSCNIMEWFENLQEDLLEGTINIEVELDHWTDDGPIMRILEPMPLPLIVGKFPKSGDATHSLVDDDDE